MKVNIQPIVMRSALFTSCLLVNFPPFNSDKNEPNGRRMLRCRLQQGHHVPYEKET